MRYGLCGSTPLTPLKRVAINVSDTHTRLYGTILPYRLLAVWYPLCRVYIPRSMNRYPPNTITTRCSISKQVLVKILKIRHICCDNPNFLSGTILAKEKFQIAYVSIYICPMVCRMLLSYCFLLQVPHARIHFWRRLLRTDWLI